MERFRAETQAWDDEDSEELSYIKEPSEENQVEETDLGDPMEDDSLPPTPSPVRSRKAEHVTVLSPPARLKIRDDPDIYGNLGTMPRMKSLTPTQDTARHPAVLGVNTHRTGSKISKPRSRSTSPTKRDTARLASLRSNSKA